MVNLSLPLFGTTYMVPSADTLYPRGTLDTESVFSTLSSFESLLVTPFDTLAAVLILELPSISDLD